MNDSTLAFDCSLPTCALALANLLLALNTAGVPYSLHTYGGGDYFDESRVVISIGRGY